MSHQKQKYEPQADLNATADVQNSETEDVVEDSNTEKSADDIAALQAENAKLKDAFLRAYAEAENTKRRCQQEIEKNSKYAIASFAKELLSVADNLQRALSAVDDKTAEQCASFIKGVEMTQTELFHVFEKFGIKKVDCLGKVFDPNLERVVQEVEDKEKPAGTIVTELQSAWTINDRILREAMVIVTKK
jgi:molecular chaperone GrpE